MYVEEWNVLFRITELFVTPVLRFELFGDEVILEFKNLVAASFDGYISIGGMTKSLQVVSCLKSSQKIHI